MALAARLYVEHVRDLKLHEMVVATELADARAGAVRAQSLSRSPGGGSEHGDDAVFALVERTQELQREWEADAAELASEREEFRRCLLQMADPRHRMLLSMRTAGRTWREIGEELRYSKSQTLRLAESAYVALWPVMPEPWRRLAFPDAAE
nr:MAG TPA: Protein of unknown function (DUF1492) [Caudoviricetes sp.]